MNNVYARSLMVSPVKSLPAEATLTQIAELFADERIGGAPVLDAQEHVVGLVSDIDIVRALRAGRGPSTTAFEVMSAPAVTVGEFDPVDDVLAAFEEQHIRYLPVVRSRRLVGIITVTDVIRHLALELPNP
jgi:CBS domain-containing protein